MAKPLSEKGRLVREALQKNSRLGNTALAEKLNGSAERLRDGLSFTPQDVSNQRVAMRKSGELEEPDPAEDKPKRAARKAKAPRSEPEELVLIEVTEVAPSANGAGLTVDDLRDIVALSRKAGGMERLVEVLHVLGSVSELT